MMKSGPKLIKPGPSTFNQDDEKRTPARLCFLKLFLVGDRFPAGSVRDLRARQSPAAAELATPHPEIILKVSSSFHGPSTSAGVMAQVAHDLYLGVATAATLIRAVTSLTFWPSIVAL